MQTDEMSPEEKNEYMKLLGFVPTDKKPKKYYNKRKEKKVLPNGNDLIVPEEDEEFLIDK